MLVTGIPFSCTRTAGSRQQIMTRGPRPCFAARFAKTTSFKSLSPLSLKEQIHWVLCAVLVLMVHMAQATGKYTSGCVGHYSECSGEANPGFYYEDWDSCGFMNLGNQCIYAPCPAGRYASECTGECPVGKTSTPGSSSIEDCFASGSSGPESDGASGAAGPESTSGSSGPESDGASGASGPEITSGEADNMQDDEYGYSKELYWGLPDTPTFTLTQDHTGSDCSGEKTLIGSF